MLLSAAFLPGKFQLCRSRLLPLTIVSVALLSWPRAQAQLADPLQIGAPQADASPAAAPAASGRTPLPVARVAGPVDEESLVELRGHLSPLAKAAIDRGPVDSADQAGQIMLLLSRTTEQQRTLDSLVDQLHNVHSANYHKWLTPEEFGRRFEPADADVAAVADWLRSKGLKVVEIPPSKTHITFTGTMGQLQQAFHIQIHHLSVDGEAHVSTMSEPQVPAALAPVIAGLHKLDDFNAKPQHKNVGTFTIDPKTRHYKRVDAAQRGPVMPDYSAGQRNLIGPQDFYTIYNENPLLSAGITGAGQTIAVIEQTAIEPGDVTAFRSEFGLPAYPATPNATQGGVNYVLGTDSGVGGDAACAAPAAPSVYNEDEGEADIDVQWAGAVAPSAIVDFVACGGGNGFDDGVDASAQHVVNYLSSTVSAVSESYGSCESEMDPTYISFYSNMWEQAAAEGITAIISAGDNGTTACDQGDPSVQHNPSVNGLASSAWNIAAGGTDFADAYETAGFTTGPATTWWGPNTAQDGSALSYIPEIAWGSSCANSLLSSYFDFTGNTQYGTTPEALCNDPTLQADGSLQAAGGSGGVSTVTPAPGFQNVYGVGLYSGSTTWRTLPDISLYASWGPWNHALLFCNSDEASCAISPANVLATGGTSFVAPQLAGMMALVNQKTGARQGQADYTLYNLAAQEYGTPGSPNSANLANCSGSAKGAAVGASCIFRDIAADTPSLQGGTIASSNVQPCSLADISDCSVTTLGDTYGLSTIPGSSTTLGYYSGAGYDLTTGLGSVNFYNLVENWTNLGPGFATSTVITSSAQSILPATGSATLTVTVALTGRGGSKAPTGTVQIFKNSTSGTLLSTQTVTGSCTGTGANLTCSGTASLAVNASGLQSGPNVFVAHYEGDAGNDAPSTSAPFTEEVALPASHFGITAAAGIGEGVPFTMTVNALDPNGFVAVAYNGTVSFKSSDPKFVNPGPLTLVKGVGQTTLTLQTLGTQTVTATDTVTTSFTGTGNLAVGPGPAATLKVTAPAAVPATGKFTITVTALDAYGVPATGYSSYLNFGSTDPGFQLLTSSKISGGSAQFQVQLVAIGTQLIAVTDYINSALTGTSSGIAVTAPNLVVTTAVDNDADYPNCSTQATPGTGTDPSCDLHDALAYARAWGVPANISFSSTVFSAAHSAAQNTITLTGGTLDVPSNVSISGATSGSGATLKNLVTIDGASASPVFTVDSGKTGVTIGSLNITGGQGGNAGGGILNAGTLTVNNCNITGNAATSTTSGTATAGGGIYNTSTGTLTVNRSLISGNMVSAVGAAATGGGIDNEGNLTLTNSTVTGNSVKAGGSGTGAGVYTSGSSGNYALLLNSTISGNTSDGQGGGLTSNFYVVLANAIIAGNSEASGPDIVNAGSIYVDSGGNIESATGLGLAPLGNNGGPTQTMPPLPGSAAICAASAANANGVPTDQRGFPRTTTYPSSTCVDSGAVQTNYALTFTSQPPASAYIGQALSPAPIVGLKESGAVAAAATSAITMTDSASLLGGTHTANLASGSAAFSNLVVSAATTSDTLTATLALAPSLNLTAKASTRVTVSPAPAALTSPAPGSTLTGPNVTFTWSAATGATGYQLWLGSTGVNSNNIYSSGVVTGTSVTPVTLPLNGEKVYARLYAEVSGIWQHQDFVYTAAAPAVLTAPTQGGTLPGPYTTFTWTAPAGAAAYQLWLGTTGVNSQNLLSTGVMHVNSTLRTNMPTNGEKVYARLYTDYNGTWVHSDYTFFAATQAAPVSPAVGGKLSGPVTTFTWTGATGASANAYQLWIGSTGVGSQDVYSSGILYSTSVTRTNMPVNGETLYARLYTDYTGVWVHQDYTMTAAAQAVLTTPSPNSTLPGATVQFTWSAATGSATQYQLWLGTTGAGSQNLYSSGVITATTVTRANVPTSGAHLYARLYTNFNGTWTHSDYTYTEAP